MKRQFIRYAVIGLTNTVLDFSIYTSLTRTWQFWSEHYLFANGVAFFIVVTWSFYWNKHWTFQDHTRTHRRQFPKFVLVTLMGISIAELVLFASVQLFHVYDLLGKMIAGPLVVSWNFFAYRLWTFTPNAKSIPRQQEEEII